MQDSIAIRTALRRRLKLQRRQLSPGERARRSQHAARALRRAGIVRPGYRIGIYHPTSGEVPVDAIVEWLRELHCQLFLPRIVSWQTRRMRFVRWHADAPLQRHRLGMMEPCHAATFGARDLDLVLLPAVAVDAHGHRLGMGGGFYDRSLAQRHRSAWRRPRLVTLVYDFQRVANIPVLPFDVPVDAVVSEHGLQWFRTENNGSGA